MSIIIKSDQLNVLIYKYFQQCNLNHAAYTFFHEASLNDALTKYKFDVKSGQLVSMIEKALVFAQIQSHITIADYEQCQEPFCLLKPHVCKIVQKAKQQKEAFLKDLTQGVYNVMKRTNSVHNTLYPNRQYEQIIYEQRSVNFFDKLPIRLANSSQLSVKLSNNFSSMQKHFCAFDGQTSTFSILSKKQNYLSIQNILPCKGQILCFQMIDNLLIVVHQGNQCQLISTDEPQTPQNLTFKLPLQQNCNIIKVNKKTKNLITFQNQSEFVSINLNTKRQIAKGKGLFEWIDCLDYLVLVPQEHVIRKHSLRNVMEIQQFVCPLNKPNKLNVSMSQIYFSVESIAENSALIYNFDQLQPLTMQDQTTENPSQQPQQLHQTLWLSSNEADNLALITDTSIKVFEVDLNNFLKVIQINSYDTSIRQSGVLKKNKENMYIVSLGEQNLIIYDVELGKIERVQDIQQVGLMQICDLNGNENVALVGQDKIFVLAAGDVEPLFV